MKKIRFIMLLILCFGVSELALSQKRRKRKKRRKPVKTEAMMQQSQQEGMSKMSMTGHGEQEKPGPYMHELGMTFLLNSGSVTNSDSEDNETDGPSTFSIAFAGTYHYLLGMFGPGTLGVGPKFSFSSSSSESEGGPESSTTSFGIGGSVIYYVLGDIQQSKMVPFVQGDVNFNSSTTDTGIEGQEEISQSGLGFGASGGVYYFLDSNVAINAGLFFSSSSLSNDDDSSRTDTGFGIRAGMSTLF